jgi:alpha-glucoside transport system substrate-binding protein
MRRGFTVLLALILAFMAAGPAAAKPAPEPITVVGPFVGPEAELLEAELAAVQGIGSDIFYEQYFGAADLVDRITGDDPPGVIIAPQPGVIVDFADYLVDLGDVVNPRILRRDFGDYLIDVVSADGAVFGAPIRADLKSLVWYKPDRFAASGYEIPETFAELVALSDRMVADGLAPWCNYIESGFATGWLGTDWVEDLLLGTDGGEVYDQWIAHHVLFADPRVENAFNRFQQMIDTAGYVWDRDNLLVEPFFFNAVPLGEEECMMHKHATSFSFFVELFGFDLDDLATFKFPSVDPAFTDSSMGGGLYVAAVSDSKDVRKLVRFMVSKRFGTAELAASGAWLLPNVRFDTALYPDGLARGWAENIQAAIAADLFRFDASDLMPPVVGAGTFWTGIADLVAGTKTVTQILLEIDASWPN